MKKKNAYLKFGRPNLQKNPFSNTWLSMKLFQILLNQRQYNLILILSFEVKHCFRLAQNKWWGISGEIKTPLKYMTSSSLLHNFQLSHTVKIFKLCLI